MWLSLFKGKKANTLTRTVIEKLKPIPENCYTATADNEKSLPNICTLTLYLV